MLHSRYPSSGWSSTHTGFPGLSGRSQSSNYLNARNRHSYVDPSRLSGRPVSPPYQPSKYGLPSDISYNNPVGDSAMYRSSNYDEDVFHRENGYEPSSNYGYTANEFDFGPYRSNNPRSADYSSDTGGPYRSNIPHTVDYSSDSGRGHVTRSNVPHGVDYSSDTGRGHMSRGHAPHTVDYSSDSGRGHMSHHMTDYTSDSGLSYRRRKSSEFDLEIPSPIVNRKGKVVNVNDDLFSSPRKIPPSEYSRINDNRSPVTITQRDYDRSNYHGGQRGRTSPDVIRGGSPDQQRISPRDKQDSPRITNHNHSLDSDNQSHDSNHQAPNDIDHLHSHDTDPSHDTLHIPPHEGEHSHSEGTNHIDSHDVDHIPSHDIDSIHANDAKSTTERSHTDEEESRPDFMSPPLYRGRSVVSEPRVTKKPPHKANDLTQWQQKHRHQETHGESDSQVRIVLCFAWVKLLRNLNSGF